MSKNTMIFIGFLAVLAIAAGYSKYILLPKYQSSVQSALPSPTPSPVPMSDAILSKDRLTEQVNTMTDRQKFAQLISLTVSVPTSTSSAALKLIEETQPGFVTLVGQYASTASAQKAMDLVNNRVATTSITPILFAVKPTGKLPQLCALDPKCLALLADSSPYSELIEPSTVPATLVNAAVLQFNQGKIILNLSPAFKQKDLDLLLTGLSDVYKKNETFQGVIDASILQILKLKEEYHK